MTELTLDTVEARRALARCTRLLLKWAEESETGDGGNLGGETPTPAGTLALQRSAHTHDTPVSLSAQIGEVRG